MQVCQLSPGQAFAVDLGPHGRIDYRLIYVNNCRAYVEPLMKKKKIIKDSLSDLTGETLAEFDAPGGRQNISPNTEVEPLDIEMERVGTIDKDGGFVGAKSKRGERDFPPKIQERPVRPNTTRARLLDALLAGETRIPALMKKFDMDRGLLVAHVHEMWKCHGYGYSVVGDAIKVVPPLASDDVEDLL